MIFGQVGLFKIIPAKMYYNPDSLATVLGLKDALNVPGVTVKFDSKKSRSFEVTYDGQVFEFKECKEGLYYFDTDIDSNKYSFLQSVEKNKKLHTKKDIKKADFVNTYQQYLYWPSSGELGVNLDEGIIKNAEVTSEDIMVRNNVYGEPVALLRGNMVRDRPHQHTMECSWESTEWQMRKLCFTLIFMDIYFL